MNQIDRYEQAKKVTLIGALVNAFLGCLKLAGGFLYHSHALVADGVHSFADLITDLMVIIASKYGSREADESHPYGHQRIETAATLLLSLFLILAGAGIAWDALDEIIRYTHDTPQILALPIAVLSIIANEGLFHYTLRVGHHIQSDLIRANAWHHRSDAASSVVVLIGLIASFSGYTYFDALAAIVVGGLIIKMGINYGWDSVKELVDTAVSPETLLTIENAITEVNGVERIHQLRSRMMGKDIFVDVHILVSPKISVSEGHFIAQRVDAKLIDIFPDIKDVTVHVDPEDDEIVCPSLHLPTRTFLEKTFLNPWQQDFPAIQNWTIHYLDGQLEIDILTKAAFNQWEQLQERINHDLVKFPDVRRISLISQQHEINF